MTTVVRRAAGDVEFWVLRLPAAGALPHTGTAVNATSPESLTPTPNRHVAALDQLAAQSFAPHPECSAVMLRQLGATVEFGDDIFSARVLKANSETPWPHPAWWRRSSGSLISLLVSGTAWFDIAGVGEVSVSAKDSWSLAAGVDHALLEASSDFQLLEIELEDRGHWPLEGVSIFQGKYSYRPVTHFVATIRNESNRSARRNIGDPPFVSLPDNPDRVWDGWPWRVTENTLQFGYITAGSAPIALEGIGVVDAEPGTFWYQT